MACNMFLKVEGIDGDSTDAEHENWIEVVSYNHRISLRLSSSGAIVGGTSDHQHFVITKRVDKASPMLAYKCCIGGDIPEVTFELCRATGEKTAFMVYRLKNCRVASVSPSGSKKAEDPLPFEELTFQYGVIEWEYTLTKPDGKGGEVYQAIYDLQQAIADQGGHT